MYSQYNVKFNQLAWNEGAVFNLYWVSQNLPQICTGVLSLTSKLYSFEQGQALEEKQLSKETYR